MQYWPPSCKQQLPRTTRLFSSTTEGVSAPQVSTWAPGSVGKPLVRVLKELNNQRSQCASDICAACSECSRTAAVVHLYFHPFHQCCPSSSSRLRHQPPVLCCDSFLWVGDPAPPLPGTGTVGNAMSSTAAEAGTGRMTPETETETGTTAESMIDITALIGMRTGTETANVTRSQ